MNRFGLTEEEKKTHLQQYNHALFKNSLSFMDVVWEINVELDTVVILADKSLLGMEGIEYDYELFFPEYVKNQIREEDADTVRENMNLAALKSLTEEKGFYTHLLSSDGEWHLHRMVLTPAFDEDKIYCVYLGALNLHEEQQREMRRYRSESQFREALISNSYFYFEFDVTAGGYITRDYEARDGSHPITDSTKMQMPIHYSIWVDSWYELYEPEFDKQQVHNFFSCEHFQKAFDEGERLLDVEVRQKKQDGSGDTEYMHIFVVLTENMSDGHVHACIIWRDISTFRSDIIEKKMTLQTTNDELRRTVSQEEQFHRAALSGSILVYNINLTKNLIEDEYYEIVDGTSYPMLELVGLTAPCNFDEFCVKWCENKVSEDAKANYLEKYNRRYLLDAYERGEYQVEIEFETVIGRGIPITLRNTILLVKDNASGDIIAMVNGRDVTQLRRDEFERREALRAAYEAANQASSAKSDFLARMSHDIRTPMNTIVGMTDIARNHIDERERLLDCLDKITVSSRHLLRLINEVLDMSKIESGRIDLERDRFVLSELFDSLLMICDQEIKVRNHTLEVEAYDITHDDVVGDRQRLEQVFMNLMSNAIKYTPNGGKIRLSVSEKTTNTPRVGCYEMIFEDNGIGMSEEFCARIFDPFERAEDESVKKEQGTGLGMAITKTIIQMMNGNIEVESEPGVGTKFTVTIFLELSDTSGADEADDDGDADDTDELDYTGYRALVVEDYDINAEIAVEILGLLGFEVELAADGKKALDRMFEIKDGYYDVIFMDIQMPVMNGHEATKAIRALDREYTRNVPIIAMTANAFAEDVRAAKVSGMNEHIAKPIDVDQLKNALKLWVRRHDA